MTQLPGSFPDSSVRCPGCGRAVGTVKVCPNCGVHMPSRIGLRTFRYAAVVVALVGLLAVWLVARGTDTPAIRIQDVSTTMDWAYVRLSGTVMRYPSYDPQTDQLTFWVDDGTGEMMVVSYGRESRALIEAGKVPTIGDQVTVRGTLKVREGFPSLQIEIPEHVMAERLPAMEMAIDEVSAQPLYRKVQVRGQVREVRVPYPGLTVLVVRDRSGEIDVVYGADLRLLSGDPVSVVRGDSVSVCGAVSTYGVRVQIALDAAESLQRLSEEVEIAVRRSIGEVGAADVGRMVRIAGVVSSVRRMSAGQVCSVGDGTGEIGLVLWESVLDGLGGGTELQQGAWLDARGPVSEYEGELQVVPEYAEDVWVVAPPAIPTTAPAVAPTPTSTRTSTPTAAPSPTTSPTVAETASTAETVTPTLSAIPTAVPTATSHPEPTATASVSPAQSTGGLTSAHLGQVVRVEGRVTRAETFSSGCRFTVDDGSGSVVVWVPSEVYAQVPDRLGWVAGSVVSAMGVVQEYRGELEVVARAGEDLEILTAAERSLLTPLGELTAADRGRWVTVEGNVVEVVPFSKGVKAVLDDGTGRITLLLWQEVYDIVPGVARLEVGGTVRATGEVDEYEGELEVVPGIGGDVVLE